MWLYVSRERGGSAESATEAKTVTSVTLPDVRNRGMIANESGQVERQGPLLTVFAEDSHRRWPPLSGKVMGPSGRSDGRSRERERVGFSGGQSTPRRSRLLLNRVHAFALEGSSPRARERHRAGDRDAGQQEQDHRQYPVERA